MKLKVLLKEKKELSEEADPLTTLRKTLSRPSAMEERIEASYSRNKNDLQKFFATLQDELAKTQENLRPFADRFKFLNPIITTLDKILVKSQKKAKDIEDEPVTQAARGHSNPSGDWLKPSFGPLSTQSDEEDDSPATFAVREAFNKEKDRREKRDKKRSQGRRLKKAKLDFTDISKIFRNSDLDLVSRNYIDNIKSSVINLSTKYKKDPVKWFSDNIDLATHLRSLYQIINIAIEIDNTFQFMHLKLSGADYDKLIKQLERKPDIIEKEFENYFAKNSNISKTLANSRKKFNGIFHHSLFTGRDTATGGEWNKRGPFQGAKDWAMSQQLYNESNVKYELKSLIKEDYTKLINKSNNLVHIHPMTYDLLKKLSIKFKNNIDYNISKLSENILNNNKYKLIVSQINNLVKNYSEKDEKQLLNCNENKYLRVNSKLSPETVQLILKSSQENVRTELVKEECSIKNHSNRDMSQLKRILTQFYPYAKEKLKFEKPVSINLVSDEENSKDPFGKTAYYNPEAMEITIFVDDRHPKDMLRSVSHELVHHSQNCKGEFEDLDSTEPGYAQKDPHLRNMEGEAYLLGNGFLVRDFEDMLKKLKEN